MNLLTCPYCQQPAKLLLSSAPLYQGRDYGPAWACAPCGAWVGCHPGTTNPLGRLANAPLRKLKRRAHAAFDPIWKQKFMPRRKAYAWLAEQLGIEPKDCHIGLMNDEQCALVETVCRRWMETPQ